MPEPNIPSWRTAHRGSTPDASDGRRSHVWGWVLLLVLIVGGVIAYQMHARSQAASKDSANSSVVSVGVATVEKKDMPYYLSGLGNVTPLNTVTVHSRVDGQLMSVNFRKGSSFTAGDVLANIDPRPFQVALIRRKGSSRRTSFANGR